MNNDKVLMPSELTAENGAKEIFRGEFVEQIKIQCGWCEGTGHDKEMSTECQTCDGTGSESIDVAIPWDTIKKIYALAVEKLSIKTKRSDKHIIAPLEPTEAMIIAAAGQGYSLEDKENVTNEYKAMMATLRNDNG